METAETIISNNKPERITNLKKHISCIETGIKELGLEGKEAEHFAQAYVYAVGNTPDKDVCYQIAMIRGRILEELKTSVKNLESTK